MGKTTLAVHIAGVLLNRQDSTLLIDCDDQADFWQFYIDRNPEKSKDWERLENSTVMYNGRREAIPKELPKGQYDHIVLDIDSPLKNIVQTIVGNDPDLILVPVNKSQEIKALRNLPRTLKVIAQLETKAGYAPQVVIVPLGISQSSIYQIVDRLEDDLKPQRYRVADEMPDCQEQMQFAIYQDRKYIWDYEGLEHLYDYFVDLLDG
ncbi:MAG: ParA family protein [Anabaena sp. 49628_E55]|nr:ParA family protein [Anabaena sp. 49628_E55]